MRRHIEGPIRSLWFGDGWGGSVLAPLLGPPAVLFGLGVRTKNLLFDAGIFRAKRGPIPVISVGNLSVGGTGKTPVARWFMRRLVDRGFRPALVARGYGADEMMLHRRWNPDAPVLAARRRIEGVDRAVAHGADAIVLDDGFQHRWLVRDLDVLLLAASDPMPARLLPRGPFREPLAEARRADVILITSRTRAEIAVGAGLARELGRSGRFPPVYPFPLGAGGWEGLDGTSAAPPEGPTVVVSSVARPQGVAALSEEAGMVVAERMDFPDHHPYTAEDVARIRNAAGRRVIVTTEKDAVKLREFSEALGPVRVLTLVPKPEPAVVRALERKLDSTLGIASPDASEQPTRSDPAGSRHDEEVVE